MQPDADIHNLDGAQPALKPGKCPTLLQRIKNPSVSVVSTSLSMIALIVAAICIAAISETLYHRTLYNFAQAALNSISSRVAYSLTVSLKDRAMTMNGLVLATYQMNRVVPGLEDAELSKTGIVLPLSPSVTNATTGPFIYNLGSKIPNSSFAISTWRDFFGSQLASMKLSRRLFFSDLEAVFTDGAFLRMETDVSQEIYPSPVFVRGSNAVLYDGILLANQSNGSSYYVRRTAITDGYFLSFDKSTIVAVPQMVDRRQERWFKTKLPDPLVSTGDIQSMGWSTYIRINATSGAAWVDLIARLDTRPSGNIGKARLSFELNSAYTDSYNTNNKWMLLNGVQTFTISANSNEVIIAADEFRLNPMLSLHRTEVPSGYTLTVSDITNGCLLSPNNNITGSLTMTCRHTVSTYGNRVLQRAREAILKYTTSEEYVDGERIRTDSFGDMESGVPYYTSFECDGEKYYVSACSVKNVVVRTLTEPFLLRWVTLSIVRQSEVTGVLSDVRAIVIVVTIAIVILLSMVFAVGTRFVLGPVGEIAYLMTASAYLRDSGSSTTFIAGLSPRQVEVINKRLRDRSLSRFAEVRAIQEAYFAMSDELRELKAYIPEHLREEIMASREVKRSPPQKGAEVEVCSGTAAAIFNDIELRELPDATFSPTSEVIPMAHNPLSRAEEANIRVNEANSLSNNHQVEKSLTPHESALLTIPVVTEVTSRIEERLHRIQRSDSALSDGPSLKELEPNQHQDVGVRQHDLDPYHPIFFADSCLVDRDITVVHLNIIGFHQYAMKKHPTVISKDYDQFITYINAEVKRFGGVLESFFGDKIWVSFNATSKCVNHQIAACYFAYMVTQVANGVSETYRTHLLQPSMSNGGKPPLPTVDKRFALCAGKGINCGVASGKAYVGPLGNSSIKRHSIISNAMTEAAALERHSLRYIGCNALVGTAMLPFIEGYLQYMYADVMPLPGSGGKRKMLAGIRGVMLGPSADPDVVRRWLKVVEPPSQQDMLFCVQIERPLVVPGGQPFNSDAVKKFDEAPVLLVSRYRAINDCFKAYLNDKVGECKHWMEEASKGIAISDQVTPESAGEYLDRKLATLYILKRIQALIDNGVNGKTYGTGKVGSV